MTALLYNGKHFSTLNYSMAVRLKRKKEHPIRQGLRRKNKGGRQERRDGENETPDE